jgi:hypothetical protein
MSENKAVLERIYNDLGLLVGNLNKVLEETQNDELRLNIDKLISAWWVVNDVLDRVISADVNESED